MKAAIEWLEAAAIIMIVGVIIILGTATLVHTFAPAPEPRPVLTDPPESLCPDQFHHCRLN